MPRMLRHHVRAAMAWTAQTPIENDGRIAAGREVREELLAASAIIERNPLPTVALDPGDFDLDACRSLVRRVKLALDEGPGFAVIHDLPWQGLNTDVCKALHWLMMSLLGRPVAQKWNGEMVYDVLDTGASEDLGAGVRGSKTNRHQGYHTDNSYNLPPDYVGLTCLQTAMRGGRSGLVSFYSAHNRLLERAPEHLERLYRDVYFERYDEFAPGESNLSRKPVFTYDGRALGVCLSTDRVRMGYRAAGEALDAGTAAALDALDRVLEDPALGRTFDFAPGETQVVNNRALGHRRTAFVDAPEPERRRHLVRIWLRDHGRRFYAG